ncbi:LuxR family transcriptional regulator [Sinomonas cyclohexanicum]|uniref:LuxR family transcriptional regulator n=1 Tax=Sinomonas cyclohexanicum TaxID=322009 RepID=A0ABM7PW14_SINCY|nr:cupin domain-containing protein [Corynebacterium cyclohexanicum]BCT76405.1 LuxR family transcriptional regulator [Corynebacterium cyclohexanicum]
MRKFSLDALAREHLDQAANGSSGRSASTVYGGHEQSLRQTLVALRAGTSLAEHDSPGEATVIVLRGRITLVSDGETWDGRTGDLLVVPPARHSIEAHEDSVILLTVAK